MFKKVIIANRGAVAARLIKALNFLGVKSVVIYSEADQDLPYVKEAEESFLIGSAPAAQSYLNQDAILEVARKTGAEALHPGYGFLAENPVFAQKVLEAGLTFIGPSPKWLKIMGDKTESRRMMGGQGMPLGPSTGILTGALEEKARQAAAIGFPLLIKPASGGGGIGMTPVYDPEKLPAAIESAESLARRSFGETSLYAEKLALKPRHVEFQIMADKNGCRATHLFERDCSVQRRRQKIVEEAGAPKLPEDQARAMASRAAEIMSKVGYDHIGTVETLYDAQNGFAFLEVNPRLQVEHAVTEEVTGVDIAVAQIRMAAGLSLEEAVDRPEAPSGHALEARIYAEDSARFLPSPGRLKTFAPPKGTGVRVETGFAQGCEVTPYYDPMIAQVIVKAETRELAINRMHAALGDFRIEGIKTNIYFLRALMQNEAFRAGDVHTSLAEEVVRTPGYCPPK